MLSPEYEAIAPSVYMQTIKTIRKTDVFKDGEVGGAFRKWCHIVCVQMIENDTSSSVVF